jgi:hypothetical protein
MQAARDNQFEGRPLWASVAGFVVLYALVLLAVGGIVVLVRRGAGWSGTIPVVAPIVIATLTGAAFYGLVRFRAPAEPSVVVLAAVAVDALLVRGRAAAPAPTAA